MNNKKSEGIMKKFDGDASKESMSCESETPLSNVPVPIPPEINQLSNFKKEVAITQL